MVNGMGGLLEMLDKPAVQGLLAAGLGAAASAGRGRGLLGNVAQGGLFGLQAYSGAKNSQLEAAERVKMGEVRDMQLRKMRAELSDEELARETAKQYFTPGTPAMGVLDSSLPPQFQTGAAPIPAKAPAFNLEGYAQARMAQNPMEGLKLFQQLQKDTPINKLDVKDFTPESVQKFAQTKNYADLKRMDKLHFADTGGAIAGLDPFTGRPVGTTPKTGNPFNDLIVAGPGGALVPNTPLIGAKSQIAKAGASQNHISLNSDKSYFGNVAEGLAKNDVAAIDAGRSAPERVASARRVKEILANSPITGTGAEARLAINKAFVTAGLVDGKNVADTETLASMLANQTLDAIKTSGLGSGQGFTDKDRQFLERAKSGNIEMTGDALRRLADLNERSAISSIKRANAVIGKLRMSPEAGKFGQQLDIIEEPAPPSLVRRQSAPAPSAAPKAGVRFLGFE